jgi:hypothetical protein
MYYAVVWQHVLSRYGVPYHHSVLRLCCRLVFFHYFNYEQQKVLAKLNSIHFFHLEEV